MAETPPSLAAAASAIAAMSRADFEANAKGMALMRAGYDGLRRNAAYALGAMKALSARATLERLTGDESPRVREAATWALTQLSLSVVR